MSKIEEILEKAHKVFMRYGIRSVNMDDMAAHLHMSKKTLYQHVKDKNDLVGKVISKMCHDHDQCITGICMQGFNAIDESYEITKYVAGVLTEVHPSVHFDLEKYHPDAWMNLQRIEKGMILECMSTNLQKGISEGLYRDDLNVPVVVRVYLSRFDACFDGELFPPTEYDFAEVQWEIFRYHIRGIASDKGLKYLKKKVQKEQGVS